ncbi:MAG: hypothetical protein LBH43_12490, partial [Treponema sp.]|nr:hypothetical protein [Treponema sp.]
MKTKIAFSKLFFVLIAVIIFISCESPLALGSRLDLDGPVISITSPMPRKTVPTQFDIEGTADDNTGISQLLIKAATNSGGFPRQWRYQKGLWDISDNDGASWSPFAQAEWVGTEKSAVWRVSVNMLINDQLRDGEYTFSVQAWNKGGFSDDNSFKAIILIVDTDPPKVDISTPYLYRGNNPPAFEIDPLKELHDFDDDDLVWQDPAYLGKFLTQEFSLRWQIEDANDVWSIDLRFYPYDSVIDNDPDTPLPDNYIYRYYKDLPSPLHGEHPQDYIKPNGSVTVPDLTSAAGVYDGGGAILFPITKKTTVKVVAACLDMAGNPNQEKTLGYFVYWPKANAPWIVFTEGMKPPEEYYGKLLEDIEQDVFMVYPGRSIKATAFHVQGVKEVRYSLYKCAYEYDATGEKLSDIISETIVENIIVPNQPYSAGMYSGIFPWEFHVPPRTGYYILKTQAYTSQGIGSGEYVMLFRVQDITFPDFPTPPNPIASEPLFKAINSNKITISGIVDDATNVESLCMVWINPESKNYAAMSQLAYFRDKDYPGWVKALSLPIGVPSMEGIDDAYDPDNLNKLWKLQLSDAGIDTETNRILFSYSQDIDLSVLNIGPGLQPLKSQVFLLRAQNPDGKCTIITYAPQGDTLAPTVSISSVVIQGVSPVTCYPNVNATIQQFAAGDTITINGTWWEDSLEYLPEATYFLPNFKITVNNQVLPNAALSFIKNTPTGGTWAITATVGSAILPIDKLKDTLVVSANVKDIGGNFAETTSSWLIQSDHLRLMRISSENEDATHTAGEKVTIFLEFSKPVKLLNGSAPVLLLNSTGTGAVARAVYKSGQANQSSCQYFEYTVAANQDTVNLSEGYLNVIDLENPGTLTAANYPFAWYKGDGDDREEVRITPTAGYNGNTKDPAGYYIRTLPVTTNIANSDYQYTLLAGKHIAIDTLPP